MVRKPFPRRARLPLGRPLPKGKNRSTISPRHWTRKTTTFHSEPSAGHTAEGGSRSSGHPPAGLFPREISQSSRRSPHLQPGGSALSRQREVVYRLALTNPE